MLNLIHPDTTTRHLPAAGHWIPEVPPPSSANPAASEWVREPLYCDLYVSELLPSRATRLNPFVGDELKPQHVSTKSSTSLIRGPDGQVYVAESTIEARFLLTSLVDPGIGEIWDQPPAIPYDGLDGQKHKHTFDYRFVRRNASREAVAVYAKPWELTQSEEHERFVQLLANHLPPTFATSIMVVTERDYPAWMVENAVLLLSVLEDRPPPIEAELRKAIVVLDGPTSIGSIAESFGGGRRAFRPIVRLIFEGVIELVEPARINMRAMVRPTVGGHK